MTHIIPDASVKKILIILGHPAKERQSFCELLALTYKEKAHQAGHQVELMKISEMDFDPILHEGYVGEQYKEPAIVTAQEKIMWADHIVIVYPLWQFMIPALLKGFMERVLTKGFAYEFDENTPIQKKILKGKTARIIQTTGMPSFMYRFLTLQHAVRALKAILCFCGFKKVKVTHLGLVESLSDKRREKYLNVIKKLGVLGL
jgi:putative NADPH-quinone reductase